MQQSRNRANAARGFEQPPTGRHRWPWLVRLSLCAIALALATAAPLPALAQAAHHHPP